MSSNLVSQIDTLKLLAKSNKRLRSAILSKADKNLVQTICEVINNLLLGNIDISEDEKVKLKRYKKSLRNLIEKSTLKKKREILIQKGGFLQFLLPAAITGIAQVISSIIGSKN